MFSATSKESMFKDQNNLIEVKKDATKFKKEIWISFSSLFWKQSPVDIYDFQRGLI